MMHFIATQHHNTDRKTRLQTPTTTWPTQSGGVAGHFARCDAHRHAMTPAVQSLHSEFPDGWLSRASRRKGMHTLLHRWKDGWPEAATAHAASASRRQPVWRKTAPSMSPEFWVHRARPGPRRACNFCFAKRSDAAHLVVARSFGGRLRRPLGQQAPLRLGVRLHHDL